MDWLTAWPWSPYAVGAGIGVLSWLTFLFWGIRWAAPPPLRGRPG